LTRPVVPPDGSFIFGAAMARLPKNREHSSQHGHAGVPLDGGQRE
jgi:hypothetical protein